MGYSKSSSKWVVQVQVSSAMINTGIDNPNKFISFKFWEEAFFQNIKYD